MPADQLIRLGPDTLAALADTPDRRAYEVIPAVASDTAVVLGRGQRAVEEPAGVQVLRRATGGGAVWLDRDLLSVDVVLQAGHPWLAGRLTDVFTPVGEAWAAVLDDLGVPHVTVHRRGSPARRGDLEAEVCFVGRSYGEVVADGRKIVGLAQRRRRHGAVVACGVLLRWRPAPLMAVLRPGEPLPEEVAAAAVGVVDLGIAATPTALAAAFTDRLALAP